MSFYVRLATHKDLDKLVYFTIAEAVEAESRQISPDMARKGLEFALENPDQCRYWVLDSSKSGAVGCVSVKKEWSVWHAGYYWWLQRMFLMPEYRGQRLPKLLIDHVRDEARRARALELRMYLHKENVRAINVFNKIGFATVPYEVLVQEL